MKSRLRSKLIKINININYVSTFTAFVSLSAKEAISLHVLWYDLLNHDNCKLKVSHLVLRYPLFWFSKIACLKSDLVFNILS